MCTRRTSCIRTCQPGPVERNQSSTSSSKRIFVRAFVFAFRLVVPKNSLALWLFMSSAFTAISRFSLGVSTGFYTGVWGERYSIAIICLRMCRKGHTTRHPDLKCKIGKFLKADFRFQGMDFWVVEWVG